MNDYAITGDPRAVALAERIFMFVLSGWSPDSSWSHPGGIRWKYTAANTSRHTCSNAPAAQLAAVLFDTTHNSHLIGWSLRIYDWVRAALLRPDDLYSDNLSPNGALDPTIWSYNQGTMIGAGVQLHRSTGQPVYLDHAVATAAASLRQFSLLTLMQQEPAFNAIFFRNLFLLNEVVPNAQYRALAHEYGEAMWKGARDAVSGLFRGQGSSLNNSASMIGIYALLAGAQPRP